MWRSLDVGAVVESLIDDAVVLAGAKGTTRKVNGAQIATRPEDLDQAGAGGLLVTTLETLQPSGGRWSEVLGRLAAARVAAIAVRFETRTPLPRELLDAADQLSLPVIGFPLVSGLAEVANAVLAALLEAQGNRLQRILDIHQRFTPNGIADSGMTEIAVTLSTLLGSPAMVTDPEGRTLVMVPADADTEIDVAHCARQSIEADDHNYGEIIALTPAASIDEDGRLALQRASLALAVRMAHASAVGAEQERFAATSLEELIAGHSGTSAEVAERAISFGWDLTRPRAVLLASIDPPTEPGTLTATLATIAAAARATLGPDAIVWTRSTTIAALVAPESDLAADRRALADGLRRELDRCVQNVTISIGVGRRVGGPASLPRSYVEASRAVDVGRWVKGRHVTEIFDELGLERLLASTPADDLAEFVEHSIGPLVDHDREHSTDLVDTLGMWLETRNMAEAARRIFVHYNTFKNRLDRIESILGPVVADAARSLECQVAIHVYRHYDGPWSTPSPA